MLFQHSVSADVELDRGCIGNFGRCEKRYGVDPIFSDFKSEMVTRNWQQKIGGKLKLATKKWQR